MLELDVLWLSEEDVRSLLDMDTAIKAVEAAFRDQGFGLFIHWSVDSQLGTVISHSMVGASDDYLNRFIHDLPRTFNPRKFYPRDWAALPPRQVRLDELITTKDTLQLAALLDEDSTFFGDLFAHVVEWHGDLYLEDGLHRALRAALQQSEKALANINAMTSADSDLRYNLELFLTDLSATARSLRTLSDYLDRHPDSLLRGKAPAQPLGGQQ